MVHELVQGREKVKLALDVVASRMEAEEEGHDLEDLGDNLDLRVLQAVLKRIDTIILDKKVHEAFVFSFERGAHLVHALNNLWVVLLLIAGDSLEAPNHILDDLDGRRDGQLVGPRALE